MFYIGDGSLTWPGVPMRDHSKEEWDALAPSIQAALQKAKLFSRRKSTGEKQADMGLEADTATVATNTGDVALDEPAQERAG
jgi:hypothetical protein